MIAIDYEPDRTEWDAFVTGRESGSFSHLFGWGEALAKTYGLPFFRLAARRGKDGEIAGVAPLILFTPPGLAARMISLPYTDAAGILAEGPEISGSLLAAALELTAGQGAAHLELRQAGPGGFDDIGGVIGAGFSHTPHSFKVGLARALPENSEVLWGLLDAKVRNQVRKARSCGCRAVVGGGELLQDFFAVLSENMRDLGSPVHALALFERLAAILPSRIIVVSARRTPAAAAMVFAQGATLYNPWASSLRRLRPLCPNMLLYWTMLAHGADQGFRRFDFGRSTPGAPTCRFKLQWGAQMQPLIWHVISRGPDRWEPAAESLVNEAWKNLDLEASRRQGPALRRWISL